MVQEHAHDYADVPPEPHRRAHGAKPACQGLLFDLFAFVALKEYFPRAVTLPPTFYSFPRTLISSLLNGCIKF